MNEIKTLAMYLPQFHEISENTLWWGKGYTEWTAVRHAERYFEGHYQPREPLGDNYYDLMDKRTMEWQAGLLQKYGLDGLCFYHYYFRDGKKILEKPGENLLLWRDLKIPFCFCWANESWVRTWSKVGGNINIWSDIFETSDGVQREDGILLEQKYDRELAWKVHFEYLLPFFQDTRYIRLNGAPVFLIYRPKDIVCLAEMVYYWKLLARKEGIEDIYVIGMNTRERQNGLDAILINGPGMYSWDSVKRGKGIEADWRTGIASFQYEDVWKIAVEEAPVPGGRTYFGAFTDFDDTPRRGKRGCHLSGSSMELFERYLYLLMKKNREMGNEFLFINAFNEWGEGMYLEPDKRNGYQYLEIMQRVKDKVNSESLQMVSVGTEDAVRGENEKQGRVAKDTYLLSLFDQWMTLREQHMYIGAYLKKYQYEVAAVYGLGVLGRHLVHELLEDGIEIKYIIDRNKRLSYPDIQVTELAPDLEAVDVIVVTAVCDFDNIWRKIRSYGMTCSIVSLSEIIADMMKERGKL